MDMYRVFMTPSQRSDEKLVSMFQNAGYEIIVVAGRNQALPPLVKKDWDGTHVAPGPQKPEKNPSKRKVTVEISDREEDGEIHRRKSDKRYVRRSSKKNGPDIACQSWSIEGHWDERLAAALGLKPEKLLEHLASCGCPNKSTCKRVAGELGRSLGSVQGHLRSLLKKARVSHA